MGDISLNSSTNYLESNVNLSNVYNALLNLLIKSGLCLDYIPFEVDFKNQFTNSSAAKNIIFLIISAWTSSPAVQRRTIGISLGAQSNVYNPSGHILVNSVADTLNATNRLGQLGNRSSTSINLGVYPFTVSTNELNFRFFGVADNNTLGLLITQPSAISNAHPLYSNIFGFYYFTYLREAGFSSENASRYIRLMSYFNGVSPTSTGVYRPFNEPGNISHIVCGKQLDIEVNTSFVPPVTNELQYATDYIYTDSIPPRPLAHLKLGFGYFEPLKPIKLLNFTESGNNTWIPVGIIGGRTLLLRCYSSILDNSLLTPVPLLNNKEVTYPHYRPTT